jgi:hypothetical protein
VNGVDLQQLHARYATAQRQRRGRLRGRSEQALRREVKVARLLQTQNWRSCHRNCR